MDRIDNYKFTPIIHPKLCKDGQEATLQKDQTQAQANRDQGEEAGQVSDSGGDQGIAAVVDAEGARLDA